MIFSIIQISKTTKMNRTYFIRVALALLINLLSTFTVRAEVGDQFIVDGLKYTITSVGSDYTVELAHWSGTKPTGTLTIPGSVVYEGNEYAVKSIGYQAFYTCPDIVSVVIPYGVETIGVQAFQKCTSLSSVLIPCSVVELSRRAFYNCSSLSSVIIPSSVNVIGDVAFYGCSSMTTVIIGSGVTSISGEAFRKCEAVTDVYCYANPSKLEWNHQGHSNFSRYMTNFHVFDTSEWTGFDGPGLMFVGDLKVDLVADLNAGIITLEVAKGKPAVYKREFALGVSSTICLPFDFTPSENIGTFYEFFNVNSEWSEVIMTKVVSVSYSANKPYLFIPAANGELVFEGTIDNEDVMAGVANDDFGYWNFTGTYAEKRWDAQNNTQEIGRIYGLASGQGYEGAAAGTEAGVFVKLNTGGIKPFRAYLEYTSGQTRAITRGGQSELPSGMRVKLVDRNDQTTGFKTLGTQAVEEWFELSGRKLIKKPTTRGLYIKNGNKVVIK